MVCIESHLSPNLHVQLIICGSLFDNSVKDIKSLYIDTTFCSPEAMYIPPREDSVATTIHVIGKALNT